MGSMKKLSVILLLLVFYIFLTGVSLAQEEQTFDEASDEVVATSEAQPTSSEALISETLIKERETQRIQELRILYRDQVEVYRNSEKAFSIAKTNYQNVQTLAALEEAVTASKTVMMDRSRVMITYLELVDAVLIETNGIELDLKNQSHTELFGLINALRIHQDTIAVSKDRQEIAVLANEFEPIATSYQSSVYKALSLIRIGKIQEVHDKSRIIELDIISEHESQEVNAVTTARRERAYAEIERNFDTVNNNLIKLNGLFQEAKRDGFSRSFYERILRDLSPVYAQISRSIDHLEELITL